MAGDLNNFRGRIPSWAHMILYLKATLNEPRPDILPQRGVIDAFSGVIEYCRQHKVCAGAVIARCIALGYRNQYSLMDRQMDWNSAGIAGEGYKRAMHEFPIQYRR